MLHPYVSQRNTDIIRIRYVTIEYTLVLHFPTFRETLFLIMGDYKL